MILLLIGFVYFGSMYYNLLMENNKEDVQYNSGGDIGGWSGLGEIPFAENETFGGVSREVMTAEEITLPSTSADTTCRFYLKEINRQNTAKDVKEYLLRAMKTRAKAYDTIETFGDDNTEYSYRLNGLLSDDEKKSLLWYSSIDGFVGINSLSRGFWNYDKLGVRTEEAVKEIKQDSKNIENAIKRAPVPRRDFFTYRGTNLAAFGKYGIKAVGELSKMEGQFMLEQGFTSTAILKEKSFIEKTGDFYSEASNIEMHYYVPAGYHSGVALLSPEVTYYPDQTEYLIDKGTLMYISGVSFSGDKAVVDAIVIPTEIYDSAYDPNRFE